MNPLHTVTLDADAETLLREHGVMVVDGDHASDYIDRTNTVTPPSWAVTATEPCVTCWIPPRSDGSDRTGPCPDCHNGSPVIEVLTECPSPRGCPPMTRQMCPHGGVHSSFWTVGEVLPIERVMPRQDIAPGINQYAVEHDRITVHPMSNEVYRWADGNGTPLHLPGNPADLIGKYALIGCEQVTR